jgi:hypothetical protein
VLSGPARPISTLHLDDLVLLVANKVSKWFHALCHTSKMLKVSAVSPCTKRHIGTDKFKPPG